MNIRVTNNEAQRLGITISDRMKQLQARQDEIVTESRAAIAKMENGSSLTDAQYRKIEARHDELMAEFDRLEDQINMEISVETRAAQRPIGRDVRGSGSDDPGARRESTEAQGISYALRSSERMVDRVIANDDQADREFRDLTDGAFLRSIVTGARNQMERRALSEGSNSAGGYTVPTIVAARMIDRLRAASVCFSAGAQLVPLLSQKTTIAKVSTDPVPAWRLENAAIAESDPTFAGVPMTANALGVLFKVSRELLEDSVNIESTLPNIIAAAMALELDRAALLGSGTAPEPRGVKNFTGLTTNTIAGGLPDYYKLVQARTALRMQNADVTAFVMSPRDEGTLSLKADSTGQPIRLPQAIETTPILTTTAMPINLGAGTDESLVIAGDWRRLMIGVRTQLDIRILQERYADTGQIGFIAFLRADVAAEHEKAFTVISAVKDH